MPLYSVSYQGIRIGPVAREPRRTHWVAFSIIDNPASKFATRTKRSVCTPTPLGDRPMKNLTLALGLCALGATAASAQSIEFRAGGDRTVRTEVRRDRSWDNDGSKSAAAATSTRPETSAAARSS